MKPSAWLIVAAFVVGTSGCALTSKADLVTTRYFTPEVSKPRLASASATPEEAHTPEIRLGRVTSGAHLRERIAYRDSAYEVGYYDDQRWTEHPEIYIRRAITRTLFEQRGFQRVVGGAAPTLDIEVLAFDELRLPSGRAARVELKVVLYESRAIILEETLTIDRPVADNAGTKIEGVVAAMAEALDIASEQVATKVALAIARHPGSATPPRTSSPPR
jgi:cholesterol transport system auxiliary component